MKKLSYNCTYFRHRPLFLSLVRTKEIYLYQKYFKLQLPILDVGCGDGFFAKVAFGKENDDRSVIDAALDLEGSRINQAKAQGIYKKLFTYDGLHIPFGDNSYSTIICNCVLEHADKLDIVVGELYRVLKKGGRLGLTVATDKWEDYFFGSLILGDIYKKWMREKQVHINLLSRKGWNEVFQRAGFTVMRETGYLTPLACRIIDILHYLCLPNLTSYKLTGKWVLFPILTYLIPMSSLVKLIKPDYDKSKSGVLFFILKK